MNSSSHDSRSDEIEQQAALWVMRCDRGLTAEEQDDYSHWLAADVRHGEAMAQLRWGWEELDRLAGSQSSVHAAPDPDLLAPTRPVRRGARIWWAPMALAAAAVVMAAIVFWPRAGSKPRRVDVAVARPTSIVAPCERQTLADGSVVDLNRGAKIQAGFTDAVRHVQLLQGEANFTVAKNPARPFVVEVAGVKVRAVGTVFNVRLEGSAVEVLVSEGAVEVRHAGGAGEPPIVKAGQHAVVLLSNTEPPQVASLSAEQMVARLAWQPRMLDFSDTPLAEIVSAFNAHNAVRLTLGDPALANVRLSATFRSDNVEGFVRLMDSDFGMRAEWRGETEVVLLKK